MTNEVQKPLITEMEAAKAELVQTVNFTIQRHPMPTYCMTMILNEILMSLKLQSLDELRNTQAAYERLVAEQQEAKANAEPPEENK